MDIKETNKKSVFEKAVLYMDSKYNENFEYIGSTDGGFDDNYRTLVVSPKNNPEIHVDISYQNIDGIEQYLENYTQIKYAEKTKSLIEQLLYDFFGTNVIVDYRFGCSNNDFDENTTFEEFVRDEESAINFFAVVEPGYKAEDVEIIKRSLTEHCEKKFSYCRGTICFARTSDEFKSYYELPAWKISEMKKVKFGIGE